MKEVAAPCVSYFQGKRFCACREVLPLRERRVAQRYQAFIKTPILLLSPHEVSSAPQRLAALTVGGAERPLQMTTHSPGLEGLDPPGNRVSVFK